MIAHEILKNTKNTFFQLPQYRDCILQNYLNVYYYYYYLSFKIPYCYYYCYYLLLLPMSDCTTMTQVKAVTFNVSSFNLKSKSLRWQLFHLTEKAVP